MIEEWVRSTGIVILKRENRSTPKTATVTVCPLQITKLPQWLFVHYKSQNCHSGRLSTTNNKTATVAVCPPQITKLPVAVCPLQITKLPQRPFVHYKSQNCHSSRLSTTNRTGTGLRTNPYLRTRIAATNSLGHNATLKLLLRSW